MENDDVTAVWSNYNARLDELMQTSALLLRRSSLAATQTVLARLHRTLWFEILMNAIVVVLLGAFAADHARELSVLLASVVLDACAIAILASTVAQLSVAGIDFEEPVIAIARKVERLKLLRARTAMWTLTLAPLMWPALAVAGLRGLLNIEPIAAFGLPWLFANVAFGVAVLVAALWIARRYGSGERAALWFRRFSESISGNQVRAASTQLRALLQYEDKQPNAA